MRQRLFRELLSPDREIDGREGLRKGKAVVRDMTLAVVDGKRRPPSSHEL